MSAQSSWHARKQQAFLLARQNRVPEALSLCIELHRELPDDAEVLKALAVLYLRSGDAVNAESSARALTAMQPGIAAGYLTLADALQAAGRPHEVEPVLRTALALNPQLAPAWLRLGNLLSARGVMDEAGRCLEKAVEIDADNVQAQHDFGVWLQSSGRLAEAIEHYRRAVALQPDTARLLNSLGSALYVAQSWDAAADCFQGALKIRPRHRRALLNLANLNFDTGEFARAAIRYQQLLDVEPGHVEAHLGLGLAYQQLERPQDALQRFRRLTELEPHDPEHFLRLGQLCLELGRHEQALDAFRQAQALAPRDVRVASYTGIALQHVGRLDDALEHFRLLEQQGLGSEIDFAGMRATIYERKGEYDKAWAMIETGIEQGDVSPRTAVVASRVCHKVGDCGKVVRMMEALLADERVPESDRRGLYFALGALQDKLKDYDAAFAAYAAGNALRKMSYSESKDAAFVETLAKVFDSDRYRDMQPTSGKGRMPVFIVGMPRSGTSLLEQILCSHPDVAGAGESLAMGKLVERMGEITGTGKAFPESVLHLDAAALESLADDYLAQLTTGLPEASRVTDKMPHNFAYVGLIRLMFPEARIIHCMRDPVDTCLSCFFQDFSGFHNYAYDLAHLGGHYLQYRRIMRLWAEVLRVPMLEVNYESLVETPEQQVRALLDYCGLEWDDACLRFYESGRNIRTASYDQVRTPLYNTSCGRWRNYRRHLGPLLTRLGVTDHQAPAG